MSWSDEERSVQTEQEPAGESLGSQDTLSDTDESLPTPPPKAKKAKVQTKQGTKFTLTLHAGTIAEDKLWEHIEECVNRLHEEGIITYCVVGLETAPTTNKLHGQGYVEFNPHMKTTATGCAKRFAPLKPHAEHANASPEQNRIYCLKLDTPHPNATFIEVGKARTFAPGLSAGAREKMDWDVQRDLARSDPTKVASRLQIQYFGNIQKIHFSSSTAQEQVVGFENYWLYGLPGAGKTRLARDMAEQLDPNTAFYDKDSQTKWWDNYSGQAVVLIDELEKAASYMGHLLKKAGDRYPFSVEMKGASRVIRPKHVIITSNYTIEDIWDDEQMRAAIHRRYRVVHVQSFEQALGIWQSAVHDSFTVTTPVAASHVAGFNPGP